MDDQNALRPTLPADAEAVAALIAACDALEAGRAVISGEDVEEQWSHFDLAADARVAGPENGPLTAYAALWSSDPSDRMARHFFFELYIHPAQRGENPAFEDALVAWLEARAHERLATAQPGATGTLHIRLSSADAHGQDLLARHDYCVDGENLIMRYDLKGGPVTPSPVWPVGSALRTKWPSEMDKPAVYALITEAFSDLPDFRPLTFDTWSMRMQKPTRWWLLAENTQGDLIGASLGFAQPGKRGWIQQIAVRRDWRRRGLALALLHQAFADFYKAGVPTVELGVDAANTTGATRVYERAGMHVAQRFVRYEKAIHQ